MIRSVKLRSLAKINLDLRVLNRRADGFHELRTVFQTISLADGIEIAFEPGRKTTLEIEDSLNIPDNLILRAGRMALDAMKATGRVRFKLRKNIPMGAGMGGGSSNAAAVLLALPVLAGKAIAFEKLLEMGAELGSDVPFFLTGGTAVAVDRGTEFYSLEDIAEEPILIVASGLHVATGAAYQALNRGLTSPDSSRNINDFQLFVRTLVETRSAREASAFGANDFEPAVFSQYPQLQALFKRLRQASTGAAGEGVRQAAAIAAPSRGSDDGGRAGITAPSGRGSERDGRRLEAKGGAVIAPSGRGSDDGGRAGITAPSGRGSERDGRRLEAKGGAVITPSGHGSDDGGRAGITAPSGRGSERDDRRLEAKGGAVITPSGHGSDDGGRAGITAPSGRGSERDDRGSGAKGSAVITAVRMTGSGSALFALFRSIEERDAAGKRLEQDRQFLGKNSLGEQASRIIPAKLVSRRSYQRMWRRQLGGLANTSEAPWPPHSRYAR